MTEKQRLAKYLARCGVASRRACEELIFSGKVAIDGTVCRVPQTLVTGEENITVKRKKIQKVDEKVFYAVYKPQGFLSSNRSLGGKEIVFSLLPQTNGRLFSAGRLDYLSEGLMVITNDGYFAQNLIHPSKGFDREYLVVTSKKVTGAQVAAIRRGASLNASYVRPLSVKAPSARTLIICLSEGKKHEVRRLCGQAGVGVERLTRTRIGPIRLGDLKPGEFRPLTDAEISRISP